MAKKSKEDGVSINVSDSEMALSNIKKKYGSGIAKTAQDVIDRPRAFLKICPSFDFNVGGIREGTLSLISGKPKSGKTTFCLQAAKSAIEDGRDVFYLSVEGRFEKQNARGIKGLDPTKLNLIQSEKGRILTGEDFLDIARDIVNDVPKAMIILDSTSNICSKSEMDETITGVGRSMAPRMFANLCRTIAGVIPINNTIFLGVQHLITNTSGKGAMYREDGGESLKFQSDMLLRASYYESWTNNEEMRIGQQVHWNLIWSNNEGNKPEKFSSWLRFGVGFDEIKEIQSYGIELGLIVKNSSWLSYKDIKVQGEEKLWSYFNDNPEEFLPLKTEVYDILCSSKA